MKKYLVGGAVRDKLLGRVVSDNDYVVVGASVAEMQRLGYRQVGKSFPVFLDENGNETALARVECKTGPAHTDFTFVFSPDVTLEMDLVRRDFTVNAMALDSDGNLIDLFDGKTDLKRRVLRHISPHFQEDPLRVLRLARLSAQLDFTAAPETLEMCRRMVKAGDLAHLSAERLWRECEKAFASGVRTERFFEVLDQCGAISTVFGIDDAQGAWFGSVFKEGFQKIVSADILSKWAVFCLVSADQFGERILPLVYRQLRVPICYQTMVRHLIAERAHLTDLTALSWEQRVQTVCTLTGNGKKDVGSQFFAVLRYLSRFDGKPLNFDQSEQLFAQIFAVCSCFSLEVLSPAVRKKLASLSGAAFGKAYRQARVEYVRRQLRA